MSDAQRALDELARRVADAMAPALGRALATETANNAVYAYGMADGEITLGEALEDALAHRMQQRKLYRAEHLTPEMAERAVAATRGIVGNPALPRVPVRMKLYDHGKGGFEIAALLPDVDRPVGHISVNRRGDIINITVHSDYQRMGIGTQLYEAAAEEAERRGKTLRSSLRVSPYSREFWTKQIRKGNAHYAHRADEQYGDDPPPDAVLYLHEGVRDLSNNPSERPRGFPWRKDKRVYHSTIALDRVIDEGMKPRRALKERIHATGGGPDEALSFTTSIGVAQAICLGLRVLARCARGEMLFGDLIIAMQKVAPKGTAWKLADMRLTPEKVERIDRKLYPFSVGHAPWHGTRVREAAFEARYAADRGAFEAVEEFFADGASHPYGRIGWAPRDVVVVMEPDLSPTDDLRASSCFEFYKAALGMGGGSDYHEVYDPFFIHTSPDVMKHVPEDQIGIVVATLDADWLCAGGRDAEDMGFSTAGLRLMDEPDMCEHDLRYPEFRRRSEASREWDRPSPADTLVYEGPHMAEIRAYDPALVRGLYVSETMEEILYQARREWDHKGIEVEDPVAWPYFKPHTPWLAR